MKIPWEIVGPVVSGIVIILILVFGFIIKFKKLDKPAAPNNPPKNSDTLSKKSLCFQHEGGIASNKTAVEMACKQIDKYQEQNRQDHKTIFTKMDNMTAAFQEQKTEILTAIKKNNG